MDELKQAVNDTLLASLTPALKGSIDRLLARGVNKDGILALVKGMANRAAAGDPNKGKLTIAAVETYLATKGD